MSEKFEDLLKSLKKQKEKPDEDDLRLWKEAKKDVKPLKKKHRQVLGYKNKYPKEKKRTVAQKKTEELRDFSYEESFNKAEVSSKAISESSRQGRRLRRRATPEATLDLHGMTQKEAYKELCHFVRQAHFYGFKTLRVITGKGNSMLLRPPFPENNSERRKNKGVLKKSLPNWLITPPLSSYVYHYTSARTDDGGEGAWYLFLKSSKVITF